MRTRTIVYGGLLAVNKLYGRNGLPVAPFRTDNW